jgi:hypothetical protein
MGGGTLGASVNTATSSPLISSTPVEDFLLVLELFLQLPINSPKIKDYCY